MMRIRQPEAFALVQEHFRPLLFRASMDSPQTIQCMLVNEQTGESLVLSGLPCGISLTSSQLAKLISVIELDIAALRPAVLKLQFDKYAG
ncbi:DUF1652 domain-containing protein [Pseudomonas sp.]|uniref:DUF1652 domain-containing protein n=1 Tax=Pseudomonas sp. TaxID=306 RepID=UPI00289E9348|nr:DUF1652 domain-containing protein [Pseudomonas sp.]